MPARTARPTLRLASAGEKNFQTCGLFAKLASSRARKSTERFEHDAPLLDAPHSRDEPVNEKRLRDIAVHADDPLAVLLPQHARAVGECKQDVVPLRKEANRCGCTGVGQGRAGNVEKLASTLVAKAA